MFQLGEKKEGGGDEGERRSLAEVRVPTPRAHHRPPAPAPAHHPT